MLKIVDYIDRKFLTIKLNGKLMTSTTVKCDSRAVFIFPDFVVKIETEFGKNAQNNDEWTFWNKVKNSPDAKYFAEVYGYSVFETDNTFGSFIWQKRVDFDIDKQATEYQYTLHNQIVKTYALWDTYMGQKQDRGYNFNVAPIGDDSLIFWDFGFGDKTLK
jgi:hypothetical protein